MAAVCHWSESQSEVNVKQLELVFVWSFNCLCFVVNDVVSVTAAVGALSSKSRKSLTFSVTGTIDAEQWGRGGGGRGRNSSVGSVLCSLSFVMQRRGFHPPLRRIFSGCGDISLGVNMSSDSIPQKIFRARVQTGLVCAHMHSIAWTQKILTFMS